MCIRDRYMGKVRVFRYPSLQKGSGSAEGRGHSSHVTCVEWMSGDSFIVSTGGEDTCVIQWNVKQIAFCVNATRFYRYLLSRNSMKLSTLNLLHFFFYTFVCFSSFDKSLTS
eukprot:TRINITY_DN4376_c0_g1_i1.p1 TRINITY_DN4376_c0_g1~~TRINITY_DN4376_c0_g1_i1.p1  ORF type:complete len:112 (+),score=11.97 TRINITY_DN4376_c0_g1_i1:64-399(+)